MSRRVLILSGDTFEIRTLQMALEVERIEVARCTNSDQLWDALTRGHAPPLALIADLKAPWDTMRMIFRRFRASERGRMSPILVIGEPTAVPAKDDVEASGVHGADFFPPPIDGVALVRRLQAIPEAGEEPPAGFHSGAQNIRGAVIGPGGLPLESAATPAAPERPRMPFAEAGSLQQATPARILGWLVREGASGHLSLILADGRSDLWLQAGKVMALRTEGACSPANLLVKAGRASMSQLSALGDPRELGLDALIGAGVLGPHEAFAFAAEQTRAWMHAVAPLRQGDYRWVPNEAPPPGSFPLDVPVSRCLLDGLVAAPPVPHPLPAQLAQAVPVPTPQAQELLGALALSAVESRVIRAIDGRSRLWNVVHSIAGDDDQRQAQLEALLIGLRDIGVLTLKAGQAPNRNDLLRRNIPRAPEGHGPPPPSSQSVLKTLQAELERVRSADPFETLGVTVDVAPEAVRKVFFDLSKKYHPDKYFEEPDEIKAAVEEIFKEIQDAYAVVSDPDQRAAYRKMKEAGTDRPITPEDENRATIMARQAELLIKNKSYTKAAELYDLAVETNPLDLSLKIEAAWANYLASPKDVVRNLSRLHAILKKKGDSAQGFYYLGVMLKANADLEQAERSFAKAVSLRPGYLEPTRELRLLEMRRRKAEEATREAEEKAKKSGGLFGFRKEP